MTNENNDTPVIETIDENQVYRATIHLYSKGSTRDVTVGFDFSHILDDNWDQPLPAAYEELRNYVNSLRRAAATYAVTPEDIEYLSNDELSDEDKAKYVLEITQAQDDARGSTLN